MTEQQIKEIVNEELANKYRAFEYDLGTMSGTLFTYPDTESAKIFIEDLYEKFRDFHQEYENKDPMTKITNRLRLLEYLQKNNEETFEKLRQKRMIDNYLWMFVYTGWVIVIMYLLLK